MSKVCVSNYEYFDTKPGDKGYCTSPKCEAADCRLLSPSKSHDVWSAGPGEWWVGAADCVAKLAQ
jgi:hypothetical protein